MAMTKNEGPSVAPDVIDRYLSLGHRLQQGALGARRGAVDFVGQQNIGKHRPRQELELARLLVEDAETGDVAGQEVGRALHTGEVAADSPSEGFRQSRLSQSGQILQQEMTSGKQAREDVLDHLWLAAQGTIQGGPQTHNVHLRRGRMNRVCGRSHDVAPQDAPAETILLQRLNVQPSTTWLHSDCTSHGCQGGACSEA